MRLRVLIICKNKIEIKEKVICYRISHNDDYSIYDSNANECFCKREPSTQQFAEETTFEIRDTNDLATLSRELDRFIAQNSDSTEWEQDQHLISFMENGGLDRVTFKSVGDYVPGYNRLNSAKRKLVLKHPVQAVRVYNDGNTATSKTIEVYGKSGMRSDIVCGMH